MVPKKIGKNNNLNHKFITMDLETVSIHNILVPYLLCWYNGKKTYSYFLLPPKEFQDLTKLINRGCFTLELEKYILIMIKQAMSDICIRKYKNYRIYLHNFSKFDIFNLLDCLALLRSYYSLD